LNKMDSHRLRTMALCASLAIFIGATDTMETTKDRKGTARSADGVEIVYSERGKGGIALVFIHGGLADRTFWAPQLSGLSDRFRIVALDLAGHGESGRNRKLWSIPAFAQDVRAVVEKLRLRRVVLIGNSLGGPVALDAAALLKGRAIGVVGVDTLHDATTRIEPSDAHARAEAFRKDFQGTCHAMVGSLFHPGAHQELRDWAEKRMCAMPVEVVAGLMEGFGGYDLAASFRAAGVPIRALNGDLYPIAFEKNRAITPDFDGVVMKDAGHYPMLERPAEFNSLLIKIVEELDAKARKTDKRN
jgi:sigma-B regulation protein RsbQ